MYDWLSHRVRASPERTALVRATTGETLDFARLDAMVEDLAGRLVGLGVEPGDHLGMLMGTRLAAVCTVHAAERLGAVLVPLGDGLTAGELATRVDAADVTSLVCSAGTERRAVDAFDGPVCSVDDPDHPAVASLAEASVADVDPTDWGLDDTRLLLFTSGTTGTPKVVQLTVGNLLASAFASAFRLGFHRDDRWLVGLSLDHMGGLSPVLRMPLYGMTVVLRESESFEPGRTADDIGNYDVTCVSLVPTMLKRMLDLRGTLADSLRVVLLGGAPAPDDLVERCRDFSVPVHPTYGMTETASQVATATPREAFKNVGTVGRPLFWTSVAVHETDGPGLVDTGDVGELVVDGPTVSPGYYGDPDATDAAFGPDGLRTGDVGYRDADGRIYVVGRTDDCIITGGENVYPREVADVLRSHPGVVDAAVVGLPDDEWGELVGALVVPAADEPTVGELDDYCRGRLAGFKLPRVVAFAEELPRTESGTVRRDAVRDRLAEAGDTPDAVGGTDPGGPAPGGGDDPVLTDESAGGEGDGNDDDPAGVTPGGSADSGPTDGTPAVSDAGSGDEDAYLVGGADWTLGDDDPGEEPGDDSSDIVTDAPADTPSAEVVSDADADPDTDTDPETPDFVQEALAEGSTTGSGDDADGADEPVEDWSEVPEPSAEGEDADTAAPGERDGADDSADTDGREGDADEDDDADGPDEKRAEDATDDADETA
jgi:O-succinylbenzoic acid--CoA ligase